MPVRNQLSTSEYANPPARVAKRSEGELVRFRKGRTRRYAAFAAPNRATGMGSDEKVARPPSLKKPGQRLRYVLPRSLQGTPPEGALLAAVRALGVNSSFTRT